MKKVNAAGPEVLGRLPIIPALAPATFKKMVEEKKYQLVDTRTMLGFGGGHIDGAINIAATPILSIWAGWFLDPEKPILLVLENDSDPDGAELSWDNPIDRQVGKMSPSAPCDIGTVGWSGHQAPFGRIGEAVPSVLNEQQVFVVS